MGRDRLRLVDGLLTKAACAIGVFDDRAVAGVWREHRDGRQDHRHRLWSLVMLELWFRQFVDSPGAHASQPTGRTSDTARALQANGADEAA